METRTLVALFGFVFLGSPQATPPQAAAPERVKLAFAPPRGSAYLLAYDKDEKWDYGDRSGEQHVHWTMRDRIATVTKKGRVFIDGDFLTVKYTANYFVNKEPHAEALQWSLEGGYTGTSDDVKEKIGKSEIPKGLHLILDARGAAEHGEC